jgi:hypothetical protein
VCGSIVVLWGFGDALTRLGDKDIGETLERLLDEAFG